MKKYKYKIKNLDCINCANQLEEAFQKIDMIENVRVNFMMQRLTFECFEENREKALESMRKIIKKEEPDVILEEI